jgi:hypothetical protein
MEFYSAIKKKKIMLLAVKCLKLEIIMSNEISHVFSHLWMLGQNKINK